MASPAELGQNIPETLPADFGEWDSEGARAPIPAEIPSPEPHKTSPQGSPQKEAARREAESIDAAKKPYDQREVARENVTASNVASFPEPDAEPIISRGYPAPPIRAPRKVSPAASVADPPLVDESVFLKRMKSVDAVVDKSPADQLKRPEISAAAPVMGRMQDKPLFSSSAIDEPEEEEEAVESSVRLDELLEAEEERRARRKWIMSACIFGGSILLVTVQLLHYSSPGKLKSMMTTTQAATTSSDSDLNVDLFSRTKPSAAHPSQAESSTSEQSQGSEDASSETPASEATPERVQTQMMQTQLMAPTRLPRNLKTAASNEAPPPASLAGASIAALSGNNNMGSVFAGQSNARVSGPRLVAVSAGVAASNLIHLTQPTYPAIARSARIQGTVVLAARISQAGEVTSLKVVSGPPMLRQSALDAVKTWKYKPYLQDNQPAEVDTTISVVFTLGE